MELKAKDSGIDSAGEYGARFGAECRSQQATLLSYLVGDGRISPQLAERVHRVQIETNDRLAAVILKLGILSEVALRDAFMAHFALKCFHGEQVLKRVAHQLPLNPEFARAKEIAILEVTDDCVGVVCWDALDDHVVRALEYAFEKPVKRYVGTRQDIVAAVEALHPTEQALPASSEPASVAFENEEVDRLKDLASDAPIIRLVQQIIDQAITSRVSDIHMESSEASLKIRFRLDGMLRTVSTYAKTLGPSVISRVKVMAGLNIAERRLPQDGRLRVTVQGKDVDLRVSSSPSLHGESVVLRILDRQDVALDFDALGFDHLLVKQLREAISRPHGIILVTGPTGSGKTTTLYAALQEINTPDKKVLTVEDPVEYTLEGINQVPIRPQIGLTFAHALRSFLRQDPDILMVGEIRDRETAEVAIQAALTGHLLLSTLHTNSAAAAMTRLLDMAIDDFLLTSTLHLVVGQRLVRKLCGACREPVAPRSNWRQRAAPATANGSWFQARGCPECHGSGYRGRTAIVEVLPVTDEVRAAVLRHGDSYVIEEIAVGQGMRTMFQHGMDRVAAGETSFEEILRVTNSA